MKMDYPHNISYNKKETIFVVPTPLILCVLSKVIKIIGCSV